MWSVASSCRVRRPQRRHAQKAWSAGDGRHLTVVVVQRFDDVSLRALHRIMPVEETLVLAVLGEVRQMRGGGELDAEGSRSPKALCGCRLSAR